MLTVIFKLKNRLKKLSVEEGTSILDVARKQDIEIEGSCEGSLACSTCHVFIDEKWINKLSPANEDEKEMLGLLPDIKKNSRLGCQVILTKNLDGIVITIPNND